MFGKKSRIEKDGSIRDIYNAKKNIWIVVNKMAEITEEEIKEHLDNLVNALYALSPTRNYVLQLLELLPKDYPKMVDAYPRLFKDEEVRKRLRDVLGIRMAEDVEVGSDLAYKLQTISENVRTQFFGSYNWEEQQKKLSEYLGRDLGNLPNVIDELWELRIQIAVSEPLYGANCEKIMRTMVKKGEKNQYFSMDLATVMDETGIDRSTLLRVKSFLTKDIGILDDRSEVFRFHSELSEREAVLKKYFEE
ncbi:MAG TPA: hypothetical protein VMW67_02585 [Desulfobacteria bacterium]|nr:hypothetical protein [Desulfobacteria bacterium]